MRNLVTITRRVSSTGILKSYSKSMSRQTAPHVHSTIFAATRTRTRRTCSNHIRMNTCPFSTSSSEPFYGNPRQEQNNSLSPLQSITLAVHSVRYKCISWPRTTRYGSCTRRSHRIHRTPIHVQSNDVRSYRATNIEWSATCEYPIYRYIQISQSAIEYIWIPLREILTNSQV